MNDKKCNMRSCMISVIAVFAFLNLYSMLVHHYLLIDEYKATAALWRPEAEMESFGFWWLLYYAVLAMVLTCWFKTFRAGWAACKADSGEAASSCCPIKSGGLCFGLKLGLVLGMGMGCAYFYMPIPLSLGVKWFFTGLFEGLGVGAILGMLCKSGGACAMKGNP